MALTKTSIGKLGITTLLAFVVTFSFVQPGIRDCAAAAVRSVPLSAATCPVVSWHADSHAQSAYRSDTEGASSSCARIDHSTTVGNLFATVAGVGHLLALPSGSVATGAFDNCSLSLVTQHTRLQI